MSEAPSEAQEIPGSEATQNPTPSAGGRKTLMLVLGVAVIGGLGAGAVVGPRFVSSPAPDAAAAEHDSAPGPAHDEEPAEEGLMFELDNIIVNPAGSNGLRFLMASVVIQLPDRRSVEHLRAREVQVRDAVVTVLGRQTLDMLTAPGARDSVRSRLSAAIAPMVGRTQLRVYLPQFVIQ